MAELVACETHTAAINRIHEWVVNEEFPRRLIRAIRTRLDHLTDSWAAFVRAHNQLLAGMPTEEDRQPHLQRYTEAEENYLHAAELLNARIYDTGDFENDVGDLNDQDSQNGDNTSAQDNDDDPQIQNRAAEINGLNPAPDNQSVLQVTQYTPGSNALPWQCRLENTWGEFDGNYMKWPAFHDSFLHAVYKDQTIPLHRKLQLLKTSLKGRAERAFGEWLIRDQNFEPAWTRLKELYDDQYRTSKEVLNRLLQLKKLETPHGGRLMTMSNTVQEVVRQLEAMGYPPNEMTDMIFIHAVHDKLDPQTSIAWDKYRDPSRPQLAELKKFLDREAKALCNAYESTAVSRANARTDLKRPHKESDNNHSFKRFKSNKRSNDWSNGKGANGYKSEHNSNGNKSVKPEVNRCAVCSEEHHTRKCQRFKDLTLSKKKEKAREAKLCFNCLSPSHSARECVARPCSRCKDKKHNDLLCDENPQNRHLKVSHAKQHNKTNGYKSKKQ